MPSETDLPENYKYYVPYSNYVGARGCCTTNAPLSLSIPCGLLPLKMLD